MPLQRTCDAENQVRNKLSNGPLRAQSNGVSGVFCDVEGRRNMPGICWYPAKRTGQTVNQGGTANRIVFVLDRDFILSGTFLFLEGKQGVYYEDQSKH